VDRNEQWLAALDEYEEIHASPATDFGSFIQWAIQNGKYYPSPKSVASMARKEFGQAVRQLMRRDENDTLYRAKQIVKIVEGGQQMTLIFDVDTGGTDSLRRKAARQRRDAIAADIFRARSDVNHMNFKYPAQEPIQFRLDFTDDFEEREVEEKMMWRKSQKEGSKKMG